MVSGCVFCSCSSSTLEICCCRCELPRFEIVWGALYVGSEGFVISVCFQGNAIGNRGLGNRQ